MSISKKKGTEAENAVVRYLQEHGFPHAERRALNGANDRGDVTGIPGAVIEVKGGNAAANASDGLVSDWLEETNREKIRAKADVGILVTKRAAFGPDRAASWSAHMEIAPFLALTDALEAALLDNTLYKTPIRMHLSTAVALLRAVGYGNEFSEDNDA